ncbi:phospholipase [Alteribacillus sp. JSM 102045]|uniref:phospholipase n=1 Tax=Alteribacillus sp. JSM 102045 TaxID=1562101 RepID=UPI0035C06593
MSRYGERKRGGLGFCIFPGYKWCGPGCNGPGVPINAVDAACRAHDLCYRRTRDYCACDQRFIRRLKFLENPHTQEGRHARMILQYMKIQRFFNCSF